MSWRWASSSRPPILGGAAVLRTVGAATGEAREMHHRSGLPEELASASAPGHSGIVALVSDPGAVEIRKALESADAIVVSGSTTYWPATSGSQPRRPRPRRTPREPENQPVRITCAG